VTGRARSYVGPCDADAGDNVVSLSLVSLEDATGTLPTSDYVNPTLPDPLTQTVTCDPNVDTPVTFNISVMRTATQGFFDVAVSFSDIFCSAKLDCGATTDSADDLNLLHRAGGGRDMTAVLALACTGGAGADTHLYLDNVEIDCGGANPTVVDVSGQGNVDLDVAPSANPDGYLFGAMVSRGSEAIYDKAYWNVSLGLDEASFPATDCRLTTTATASDGPLDGGSTPDNTTWPIIEWDVVLSTSGARACTQHPLNGTPAGVAATYTPLSTPEAFDWVLVRAPDALVDEANCNPATRTADDYCGCPAVDCTASNKTCDATTDPGAPACVGNFYGDGSDGDLVVSAPLSLTVPTKHGAYDGDMVVMQYDNLTVSDTLTLEQPARGLLVYVTGDLHVTSGGRISMTARGAAVNPAAAGVSSAGLRFRRLDATGTEALAVGGLLTGAGAAAVAAEDNQPELVETAPSTASSGLAPRAARPTPSPARAVASASPAAAAPAAATTSTRPAAAPGPASAAARAAAARAARAAAARGKPTAARVETAPRGARVAPATPSAAAAAARRPAPAGSSSSSSAATSPSTPAAPSRPTALAAATPAPAAAAAPPVAATSSSSTAAPSPTTAPSRPQAARRPPAPSAAAPTAAPAGQARSRSARSIPDGAGRPSRSGASPLWARRYSVDQ